MTALIASRSKEFDAFLQSIQSRGHVYAVPGNIDRDIYLLPVSGGADSTALAILLHILLPSVDFKMVFTDTRAEPAETYASLDRLEQYLGKPILRLVPDKGLFELVDHYNGFLPSAQQRWCTRELKLVGFQRWIKAFTGQHKWMFVGIRADEQERLAFTLDDTTTEMPFVDLGIRREDVFQLLNLTIGIPSFYKVRTRSGCSTCFFQRRSELVGLYQYQPIEFHRGRKVEKIADTDKDRHQQALPLWKDSGIALNWLHLPVPVAEGAMKGKRPQRKSLDLFGNRGIFVAGEFFYDGMYANDEFIWHQRVISYSPTLAGIKGQVNDRFRHLLATSEVFDMTPDEVRTKARFAIWYIELPEDVFDPDAPSGASYTWQKDASYAQLEHITSWVTRALHAESMRQTAERIVRANTVQEEWQQTSVAGLVKVRAAVGHVANSHWYIPTEVIPEMTDEEMLKTVACPMCSI